MRNELIIVTGYFGAPAIETAQRIAEERGLPLVDLDRAIEEEDGCTIRKTVMMYGEHQYRNREFETLKKLSEQDAAAVICCGDGVLHDDDSKAIIEANELVIAGGDMTRDQLWENARLQTGSYHAFMSFGTDEEKRAAFEKLIDRQNILFGGSL